MWIWERQQRRPIPNMTTATIWNSKGVTTQNRLKIPQHTAPAGAPPSGRIYEVCEIWIVTLCVSLGGSRKHILPPYETRNLTSHNVHGGTPQVFDVQRDHWNHICLVCRCLSLFLLYICPHPTRSQVQWLPEEGRGCVSICAEYAPPFTLVYFFGFLLKTSGRAR